MSQSLASLDIIHLRNHAVFNKRYFADNGRVYIGTKDGKLRLEDKAVETSFSPTATINETNVQDAIENLSSGSNIGSLLTDTATIDFTYNPVVPASITADLKNTTVTAAIYGSATQSPVITIDAQGRITNAVNAAIAIAPGVISLTQNNILVGDAGNLAADVAMSGEASIVSSGAITLLNSAVISKILTGYVSGAGVIASTDNILQAFQKLNGNILALVTGVSSVTGSGNIASSGGATPNITFTGSLPILNGGTGQTTATLGFNALSPLTTLGDILLHDGVNNVRLPGNITSGLQFLGQTGTGLVSATPTWTTLPTAGVANYFFYNTASDIGGGYLVEQVNASVGIIQTITTAGLGIGTSTLANFASLLGFPNITFQQPGVVSFYVTARQSAGTKTSQLFGEIYKRTAAGVETLLSTTAHTVDLTGIDAAYIFQGAIPTGIVFMSTDRYVAKVKATVSGGGSVSTIVISCEGVTAARCDMPAATVDANNFVPYTGALNNVDLNAKALSNVLSYNKVTITTPATGATLTLADNSSLITSGAFLTTFTSTAPTTLTLPITGTLATLAGAEALSNKTGLISQWTNDTGYLTSVALTAGQIGFGSAGNVLTSDATFTWDNTSKNFNITGTISQVLSNSANVWYVAQGNVGYWYTGSTSTGLLSHQGFGIDFKTNNKYTMGDVGITNNTHIEVNDTAQTITLTHGGTLTTGTISSGLWNGTVISPVYGGTGVANNVASTLAISGAFATTLTVTGVTGVTLPLSGTLYGTLANSITSAQLSSSLTDETGTLLAVFSDSPTFTTQIITPLIYGSTAANGDIRIEGTSSATKTTSYVNLQTTGGNVGIGTTAPSQLLDIRGTIPSINLVDATDGRAANIGMSSSVLSLWSSGAGTSLGNITFKTGSGSGVERMRINATGLGIGTTTPTAVLHLKAGTATANTAPLQFTSGTVETVARAGVMEYNGQFSLVPTDATRRFITLAASSTKTIAGAPYVNDGYITLNINGTDIKIMTTA